MKEVEVVFVDISIGAAYDSNKYLPIIRTIEMSGAEVINIYFDEKEVFKKTVTKHYGPKAANAIRQSEINDVISMFPGLVASIMRSIERFDGMRISSGEQFERITESLASRNPYQAGPLPLLSGENNQLAIKYREEYLLERRKTEPVFVIGPDDKGALMEEYHGRTRSQERLNWAEERLKGLGFTKVEEGNRIAYKRVIGNYALYADPRPDSRIDIYVHPVEISGSKGKRRYRPVSPGRVAIPDFWKHDLEKKLLSKLPTADGK